MDIFKAFVSGVIVIGLVTAVGLHGNALGSFVKSSGSAGSSVLNTAEKG